LQHTPSYEERAILFARNDQKSGAALKAQPFDELSRLAASAGAQTVGTVMQDSKRVDPAFFITSGKLEALKSLIEEKQPHLVICNDELSPAQQRNLEDALGVKVIDRTGLILDIFAQRARSREGKLQVELAQLDYIMPRLKGRGSSLSRPGGGIGTRGPGETKIEMDRRKVREKMTRLKKELLRVAKTRMIQRHSRAQRPACGAALVGYTNAGKSTLLNRLTGAGVHAENRLFSTLDPTARRVRLGRGAEMVLTDTVGFIDRLPHQLVAAFKATLEEVREASLLLHVMDGTSPFLEEQVRSVDGVLEEIGAGHQDVVYVLNKTDALEDRRTAAFWRRKLDPLIAVSARTGEGMQDLCAYLDRWQARRMPTVCFRLPLSETRAIDRVLKSGTVFFRQIQGSDMLVEARVDFFLARNLQRFAVPGFGGET